MPGSIVAGNLLIGFLSLNLTPGATPSWPAGWSVAYLYNTSGFTISIAWKIAVGSDAAPTVSWTGNTDAQLSVAQYTGNHATSPIGNIADNPHPSGATNSITGTAVTTANNNSTVAAWCMLNNTGSVTVEPSGSWTREVPISGVHLAMYDTPMVSAGSAPAFALTFSNNILFDVIEIELKSAVAPLTGTMGPTEAKDTLAASGGSFPTGTMGPTEAHDTWTTPPFGTMGATEAHDAFACTAFAQVKGSMGATETADAYHMAGGAVPDLTLDAFATGEAATPPGGPAPTSVSATISTTFNDDVIVVMVASGGFWDYHPVLGVSDTAGLTWHRRASRPAASATTTAKNVEIWWAHAPTPLSADVITVTTTGGTGQLGMNVIAIGGANFSAPWDAHPYANQWNFRSVSGASIETGFASTNAAKTMTLLMSSGAVAQSAANTGFPYTFLGTVSAHENNGVTMNVGSAYSVNGTALDHLLVSFGPNGNSNFFSDSIVQAGQTGTANEVLYWLDGYFWQIGTGVQIWPSNASIFSGANGTVQCSLNTVGTNEVIMAVVSLFNAGGTGEVSSVADSAGLASGWTRRSRETSLDGKLVLEVWYAIAPAAVSGMAITAHTTGTVAGDYMQMLAFGVAGATYFYDGVLWDGHPSLPDESTYTSAGTAAGQVVTGMSTINVNTLDLAFMTNIDATKPFQPAPGGAASYPDALGPFANTNSPNSSIGVLFKFSGAPLASDFMASTVSSKEWVTIGDALPVGPPQPPVGLWGSHEGVDIWSAAGFVPAFGTMNPTEAKDTTGGAPNIAPFTGVGWLGWVPAFATLGFTDSQDRAVVEGWVIGAPLTGVMGPTESKDRAALSNRATVTGTMGLTESRDRVASSGFELPKVLPGPPRKRRVLIVS